MSDRIVYLERDSVRAVLRKPDFPHVWEEYPLTAPEQVLERVAEASIVIVNKVQLRGELLARLPQLRFIACAATGTDNVDLAWCREHGKDYLPVVFPGFSWHNLKGGDAPTNAIPRLKGKFLWSQYAEAKKAGASMIYQAMFDEMDEGTCIFKCANNVPVGASPFVTYEGLPSDFYLRLVGEAGRMLRGEIPVTPEPPLKK